MKHKFLKPLALITAAALLFSAAGCSGKKNAAGNDSSAASSQESSVSSASSIASSSEESSQASSEDSSIPAQPETSLTDAEKIILTNIKSAAQDGKVLHCDFAAKAKCIDDVQKVWGNGKDTNYVAAAKGTYVTYPEQGIVFGYNKGSQIIEVRTFDEQLQKTLTLSKIETFFGKPGYEEKTEKEEIIGFVVNKDFKLLFVFEPPSDAGTDPALDHYSVLFPAGTVNSMAGDPGREW